MNKELISKLESVIEQIESFYYPVASNNSKHCYNKGILDCVGSLKRMIHKTKGEKKNRQIIGRGWRLSTESHKKAMTHYGNPIDYPSIEEVKKDIKRHRESGDLSKTAKPKIFVVYAEDL